MFEAPVLSTGYLGQQYPGGIRPSTNHHYTCNKKHENRTESQKWHIIRFSYSANCNCSKLQSKDIISYSGMAWIWVQQFNTNGIFWVNIEIDHKRFSFALIDNLPLPKEIIHHILKKMVYSTRHIPFFSTDKYVVETLVPSFQRLLE